MAEKTKAELEQELADARAENESLRRQLAERPGTALGRPANPEPRFELSAGEAADLAQHGHTRSARTGETILASDFPDEVGKIDEQSNPDDPRTAERIAARDKAEDAARQERDARAGRAAHEQRLREV